MLEALENSVSMYPKLEGRFPQVAGINFGFDPNQPPGKRVDPLLIRIGDEYLNLEQSYRLTTKSYLHKGCDGYIMLKDCEILVSIVIHSFVCKDLRLIIFFAETKYCNKNYYVVPLKWTPSAVIERFKQL